MSSSKLVLQGAAGAAGGVQIPNVEDVFFNYLYTGNGSSQTITNGLDLGTDGGLVWAKRRNSGNHHYLFDTERSLKNWLQTDSTAAEAGKDFQFNAVAYGNSTYVAATSVGFFKSTDGTTWSEVTDTDVAGKDFAIVKYVNSRFIAASGAKEWATSTDGTNWTTSTITTGSIQSNKIFYANGKYMVGAGGSSVYISSDHGSTWSTQSVGIGYNNLGSVGNAFVATNGNAGAQSRYSTDGTTWNNVQPDASGNTSLFQFDENPNIIFSQWGYTRWKYSTNGSSWTQFSGGSGLAFPQYRAYAPTTGKYYLTTSGFAGGTSQTLTSSNGTTWTATTTMASTGVYGPAASDGSNFIIGTSGSTYYTSSDGTSTSWTSRTAPTGISATNRLFQAGGRAFIATTASGQFSSNDDVTDTTSWDTEAVTNPDIISVSTTGFSLLTDEANSNGDTYAAWAFKKAENFFDCIEYTGNGTAGRTISHNLNSDVGMLVVKKTSGTDNWFVWHRGLTDATYRHLLNSTSAETVQTNAWNSTAPTSTEFTLGDNTNVNESGETYIAYLFAHNDTDNDIIKCGTYSGTGSAVDVTLGFEPQWIMVKRTDSTSPWTMWDVMRGLTNNGTSDDLRIKANDTTSEGNSPFGHPTATGFTVTGTNGDYNASGGSYIYVAIRRGPMAVPTDATDVFDIAWDGATDGEKPYIRSDMGSVDLAIVSSRTGTIYHRPATRLTSGNYLETSSTGAEVANASWDFDYQNGLYNLAGSSVNTNGVSWLWKRAPSFCDVVAYTGNGTAGRTVSHNLGVVPEMMWVKRRDSTDNWLVYHSSLGATKHIYLNTTGAALTASWSWNDTAPTDTVFSVSNSSINNGSGADYIAYLFASLDGVSKVGSFTMAGSDINVDCGFSSGARFVLLKRTDSTGNWLVFDSERGIVAGADPYLLLNTTDAEDVFGTLDIIDPHSSGFTAVSANIANGDWIFYAIA